MVVGHIKFSPDSFFGLFKLKLRKAEVDNLDDLIQVVKDSTVSKYNLAQTVFDKEGKRIVFFYAQTEFLNNYFRTIPDILKQHYFIFSKDKISSVDIRETVDGERHLIDIRKTIMLIGFSYKIISNRLSIEKKWYLYK